jgi:hypothetical protein
VKGPEVLERARVAAAQGRVTFSKHAANDSMPKRHAHTADVLEALNTAIKAEYDPPGEKWKLLGGKDLDGDGLKVIAEFREDGTVHVVTIF